MTQLLLHLTLALLWVLLWGSFDLFTLLAGLVIGFALMLLQARTERTPLSYPIVRAATLGYPTRLWRLVRFIFYFLRILILANWQVAKLILAPSMPIHPRIIRYDVADLTPVQLTTLANAITLTPGTLSADVSQDDRTLYVHCLNAPDPDEAMQEIDELKRKMLRGVFS